MHSLDIVTAHGIWNNASSIGCWAGEAEHTNQRLLIALDLSDARHDTAAFHHNSCCAHAAFGHT
jgi:hypothetical protein